MNKKAQAIDTFLIAFFMFILVGVLLAVLSPAIDSFRLSLLANPNLDVLSKFFWYSFFPLMWGLYLLIGVIGIKGATQRE